MKLIFYEGRGKVEKRKRGGKKKTSISDGNTKEKNFKGGWFEKECQVEKEAGSKSVSPF